LRTKLPKKTSKKNNFFLKNQEKKTLFLKQKDLKIEKVNVGELEKTTQYFYDKKKGWLC